MFLNLWNDESGSSMLENMLWIALFVLGVAAAAVLLKDAVTDMAKNMADKIKESN